MQVIKDHGKFSLRCKLGETLRDPFSSEVIRFNTEREAQKYIDRHPYLDEQEEEAEELLDDTENWTREANGSN